jgi:chromosome segregation ATPase
MSVLDSRIRVHRWQRDERERYLAELEVLAARLGADATRLQAEAEREAEKAGTPLAGATNLSAVTRALLARRDKLARSVAEIATQIAEARDAAAAAQREVERYEREAAVRARRAGNHRGRRRRTGSAPDGTGADNPRA